MSKEALIRDKRTIDGGLTDAKQYIAEKNYDACAQILSRISPTCRRINYREFELAFITTMMYIRMGDFAKARENAVAATRLKPDDPLPWKSLIQIDAETENPKLDETIIKALEACKPDLSILKLIAPHLIPLENETIDKLFIRFLDEIDGALELPITQYLPETPLTLDIRLRMLKLQAKNDPEVCSKLIHTTLEESDIFQAPKYIMNLPIDNPDRIYVEALLGDDPLGSARKHIQTGSNIFADFVKACDKKDLNAIRQSITLIPPFVSGWMYYIKQLQDPQKRLQAINDALSRFPDYIPFMIKLAEVKEELGDSKQSIQIIKKIQSLDPYLGTPLLVKLLIRIGRGDEAEKLMNDDPDVEKFITPEERTKIDLLMYKSDKNKDRLRRILECPISKEIAAAKAEAVFEMRNDIDQETCEKYFVEAMKADKDQPITYLMFGKYQLDIKKDEDKAVFLFQKAYDLGLEDTEVMELTSRSLIHRGDYDAALRLCQKVDNEWSHFRAGLILQNQQKHEEACEEFQKDLRFNKDRKLSWSCLGHSYIVLGRAMSAISVAQQLMEMGDPDLDLEYQIATIFGKPIHMEGLADETFGLSQGPIRFYSYLQQSINSLRLMQRFGRKLTCQDLIQKTTPLVEKFVELWGSNASVLKISGDYYIEAFNISNDSSFIDKSQKLYMRRCELDCRAESFIDLAHALHLKGQDEASVTVLRRALKSFTEHSGLWMHLGIAFAITKRFPFARHCLCVAAKLSTSTEMARSYACVASVALTIGDDDLLKIALNAARSFNPYDPDVWQILIKKGEVNKTEASEIAFQFGASSKILENLPLYCMQESKPKEALGYAMMTESGDLISDAFESQYRFDYALQFAEDDKRKERLERFQSMMKQDSAVKLNDAQLQKLEEHINQQEEPLKSLGLAAIKLSKGQKKDAFDAFKLLLEDDKISKSSFGGDLEKVCLQIAPKDIKLQYNRSTNDPIEYLYQCRRTMSTFDSLKHCANRFSKNLTIIKSFIMECLKNEREEEYEAALQAALLCYKYNFDRELLRLISVLQLKLNKYEDCYNTLQLLSLICPSLISKLKPTMDNLSSKIQTLSDNK